MKGLPDFTIEEMEALVESRREKQPGFFSGLFKSGIKG